MPTTKAIDAAGSHSTTYLYSEVGLPTSYLRTRGWGAGQYKYSRDPKQYIRDRTAVHQGQGPRSTLKFLQLVQVQAAMPTPYHPDGQSECINRTQENMLYIPDVRY